jgi:PHP family Zn ribbon phosphoesterase
LEDFTYDEIYQAIKSRDLNKIKGTLEFYPEEGMYHYDGHRECGVVFSPSEINKHHGICPVCKKPLTIGVASRINEMAAQPSPFGFGVARATSAEGFGVPRPQKFILPGAPGFEKLIELDKLIAESLGVKSRSSVRVKRIYNELIAALGDELSILRTVEIKKIESFEDSSREASLSTVASAKEGAKWGVKIAEAVRRMRAGEVTIKPGFDGQYGEVKVFSDMS